VGIVQLRVTRRMGLDRIRQWLRKTDIEGMTTENSNGYVEGE
jgi:hypothetical protein